MTRETRIGLLVGLMFIVLFGLVLSELTGDASRPPRPAPAEAQGIVARLSIEGLPEADFEHIDYVEDLPDADVEGQAGQLVAKDAAKTPPLPPKASILVADTLAKPSAPIRIHVVRYGESLCKIAGRYYGNQGLYKRIFEANRDKLPDAATVIVGQKLLIPSLLEKLTAPHGRGVSAVRDVAARGATDGASRRLSTGGYEKLTIKQLQRRLGVSDKAGVKTRKAFRIHTVRRGDTLSEIALKYLGSQKRSAVRRIFEANKDTLSSPDEVFIGMKLKIPS